MTTLNHQPGDEAKWPLALAEPLYALPLPPAQVRDIPEGWQPIETAPFDAAFIGIDKNWDVARCWRFAPSGRTDEVLRWKTNKPFHATHWQPISPPAPETT